MYPLYVTAGRWQLHPWINLQIPCIHCIHSSPSGTVPIGGGVEVPVAADGRGEPGETDSQRSTAPPSEAGSLQQEEEQPDVSVQA